MVHSENNFYKCFCSSTLGKSSKNQAKTLRRKSNCEDKTLCLHSLKNLNLKTAISLTWIFDFALVTIKEANFTFKRHFGPYYTIFSLHSSQLRAVFSLFHFFTFKNGLLSLFTLVTLNMVSPPLVWWNAPFFPVLFFYVYIESPNPKKNPEGPKPLAPNPIN